MLSQGNGLTLISKIKIYFCKVFPCAVIIQVRFRGYTLSLLVASTPYFFIVLKERKFHILADEGINQKVDPGTWDKQTEILTEHFKNKQYTDGIIKLIENMGQILSQYFPIKDDDTNELSDEVVIR